MRAIKLGLIVLLIVGCDSTACTKEPDQKERQRIFKECLERIPAGPQTTHYNDWSEVVDECESAAYYQSLVSVCYKDGKRFVSK